MKMTREGVNKGTEVCEREGTAFSQGTKDSGCTVEH